jgi:hypothetical protein
LEKVLVDSYCPVISKLGQRGETKSIQPLWRMGWGVNVSGKEFTVFLVNKETVFYFRFFFYSCSVGENSSVVFI